MRKLVFGILSFLWSSGAVYAQNPFAGVVANIADSGVIANASITILPGGKKVMTDDNGRFVLPSAQHGQKISFAVTAIGVTDTVTAENSGSGLHWILVKMRNQQLADFILHSQSAEDVVRKAVSRIPDNYAQSPYFCYSSYRQYQRLDSTYTNLVEARPVIMMNISETKGGLARKEAYANITARRSYFAKEPWNAYFFNATDIMSQDPVYHLDESSLFPGRFFHYKFRFDTLAGSDTNYVIRYRSNDYSTERHGVGNPGNPFPGESWEEGSIVIDRNSFAIKRFTRYAKRHEGYHYPRNNNFVIPDRLYYVEFIDATFIAEYCQLGARWYPKKLFHRFANDCFASGRSIMPNRQFTCYYEWQADSFSRTTGEEYVSRFYNEMYMWPEVYDSVAWTENRLPYHFTDSAVIFRDLERNGNISAQFIANVKPQQFKESEPGEHMRQSDR